MGTLKSMLQRSQAQLKPLVDREFRFGKRWREWGLQTSPEELQAGQLASLSRLLAHFRGQPPIQEHHRFPEMELTDYAQLAALPVLDRRGLRELYPVLEELYRGRRDVVSHITSGSTAEPAQFCLSRRLARRAGGCNLGMYQLLGWRPGMPRLCLWGNPRDLGMAEQTAQGIKGRLLGWLDHTTRYGGFAPTAAMYRHFIADIRRRPGCAVYGYASLLEDCARRMLEWDEELPAGHLATVWTCAELLPPQRRALISQAFGRRVQEHYGSRECSTIATECAAGNRHIAPRYIAEVLEVDSGEPCAPGEVGRLVFSDLFNDVTPFIRYEIGDLGAVDWRDCPCGARGPCVTEITGRIATLIALPSGRRVSTHVLAYIMRGIMHLQRYQVSRTSPCEFECRYVGPLVAAADLAAAAQQFSKIFDGAGLQFIAVDELNRSPAGKVVEYHDLSAG